MKRGHFEEHWHDDKGRPAGGVSSGRGFAVSWQNGPLGLGETRMEPNGAFVEDIIQVVIGRIRFYQDSEFACEENEKAIMRLWQAAEILDERTRDRELRRVEGTHAK